MEDTESKGKQPTAFPTGAVPERKAKSDAELRAIMKTLMENPDAIADLSDDDVIELKKRVNPVGTFEPAQKSFAVASIINMKEADMRKFMMTAMIGFVYRRLEEYVPDFVIAMEESYAAKINETSAQEHRDGLREECKRRAADYKRAHQTVIRTFLDSIFSFDPDKHVRRAPAELPIDAFDIIAGPRPTAKDATDAPAPATSAPATAATSASAATADLVVSREAFADATDTLRKEINKYDCAPSEGLTSPAILKNVELATYEAAEIVYRNARVVAGNLAQGYRIIGEHMQSLQASAPLAMGALEDARQILQKCRARIDDAANIVGPYSAGRAILEARNVLQVAPPTDVFYHFGRYIDSHYEVLRILTDVVYQTPPGIENIVIYYDTFDDVEKAKEYVRIHEAEFRADPKIIENGGVTLLGPFRENRDHVDFYNRNTEVLRIMMEQVSKDHQLGKDLTKHKIIGAKRKNVREAGPDDAAGLERYMGARGIISQFGKKPSLTRTEREQLVAAQQTRAEFETPDGALAMRVLRPTLDDHGIPIDLEQSFFYAEAANVSAGGKQEGGAATPGGAAPGAK